MKLEVECKNYVCMLNEEVGCEERGLYRKVKGREKFKKREFGGRCERK